VARRRAEARFRAPAARLALGAGAGVIGALLFLLAFHALAVENPGAPWERAWLLAIHAGWGRAAAGAARDLSLIGYADVVVPVATLLCAGWVMRRQGWKAARLFTLTLALAALDLGAKPLFGRPRPALFPHAFVAGASYPSGHALFAVGFYGPVVDMLAAEAPPAARVAVLLLWAIVAAGLGLSRLVLGVHWPTDVVAGYVAGALVWIAVSVAAARPRRPQAASAPAPPPAGR
jgi:undecaprenyl-diphosphatase